MVQGNSKGQKKNKRKQEPHGRKGPSKKSFFDSAGKGEAADLGQPENTQGSCATKTCERHGKVNVSGQGRFLPREVRRQKKKEKKEKQKNDAWGPQSGAR